MAERFKSCSVDGCNGDASRRARGVRGLCAKHYHRFLRHGDPLGGGKMRDKSTPRGDRCAIAGCNGSMTTKNARKGWCGKHYIRWWKHGDPLAGSHFRHGQWGPRLYDIWAGMLIRCGHRPGANARDAINYRDKGVRVCLAWQEFPVFAEWAKTNDYADNRCIDRKNADLGYEPDNCRWVSMRDNLRSKKSLRLSIEDAREIRRLRATGMSLSKVGKKFGIGESHVLKIAVGRVWAE